MSTWANPRGFIALLVFVWMATLPATGLAIKDPAGVEQERKQVRHQIKKLTQEIQTTTDEKAKVNKLVALLAKRLNQTQRRIQSLKTKRSKLQKETDALTREEKELAQQLRETEDRLAQVLRNQYQRQEVNPTHAWLAGQSASRAAREGYWFEMVSEAEKSLSEQQVAQSQKLAEVRKGLESRKVQLQSAIRKQAQRERELKEQRAERQLLMADLNAKLKNQELSKKRLERNETRLSKLINELTQAIEAAKREQERRQKAIQAEARRRKSITTNRSFPTVPDTGDFAKLKGRLALPVQGKITGRFGRPKDATKNSPDWKGIFIETTEGQPVLAAGDGRVVFSEWLRGFGEIVIIDHGDQFLSVYGNNSQLFKSAGENVKLGDKIAETGTSSGNLPTGLYFELRHRGKPFNPYSWTQKGR